MDDHHVPTWLANVKEVVAEFVRDPRVMLRFREQVRCWSADVETQKAKPDFAPLTLRFPLPIGQQTLTLIEEYVTVSAIHDWLTEESEHRIDPWREVSGPECHEANSYFVLHWQLDQNPLHGNEQQRILRAFEHVKKDVAQQTDKSVERNRKPPAGKLDGQFGADGFRYHKREVRGLVERERALMSFVLIEHNEDNRPKWIDVAAHVLNAQPSKDTKILASIRKQLDNVIRPLNNKLKAAGWSEHFCFRGSGKLTLDRPRSHTKSRAKLKRPASRARKLAVKKR